MCLFCHNREPTPKLGHIFFRQFFVHLIRKTYHPGSPFHCQILTVKFLYQSLFFSDFFFPLFLTEHWLLANLTDGQPSMMQAVDFWQHSDQRIKSKKTQCNADTKHHQEFQRLSYVTLFSRITVIVRVILFDCHKCHYFPRSSKFSSIQCTMQKLKNLVQSEQL